jgi:hypothetical protein
MFLNTLVDFVENVFIRRQSWPRDVLVEEHGYQTVGKQIDSYSTIETLVLIEDGELKDVVEITSFYVGRIGSIGFPSLRHTGGARAKPGYYLDTLDKAVDFFVGERGVTKETFKEVIMPCYEA